MTIIKGRDVSPELWGLIERYAQAKEDYNQALKIDVGVDQAARWLRAIELDLRATLTWFEHEVETLREQLGSVDGFPANGGW